MKFPKAAPWMKELFADLLQGLDCEPRSMFGFPCAFVRGHMFAGTFGAAVLVRLPEDERAKLLAVEGAQTFDPMGGRPMREYVQVPEAMHEDEPALRAWVRRAYEYGRSLPPRPAKKTAKKPAAAKAPVKKAPAAKKPAKPAPKPRAKKK